MIGKRFNHWLVNEKIDKDRYRCTCDCGAVKIVFGGNLRQGKSKSCGCWASGRFKVINKTHGMSHSPEHRAWCNMRRRCTDPKVRNYDRYGGRGIKVCDRWIDSFENFYLDMGPRPSSDHSIDRINFNGDYTPENCRWATRQEQASNKSDNVLLELDGEMLTSAEFARRTGFSRCTVYEWTTVLKLTREQIEERLAVRQRVDYHGEKITVQEFARRVKHNYPTIYYWVIRKGLTVAQIEEKLVARKKATLE